MLSKGVVRREKYCWNCAKVLQGVKLLELGYDRNNNNATCAETLRDVTGNTRIVGYDVCQRLFGQKSRRWALVAAET